MTIKLTGVTADELLAMGDIGPCELIDGEVVTTGYRGFEECDVAAQITATLVPFVRQHSLGKVVAGELGFKISSRPDTVRCPDVAFISTPRLPTQRVSGFLEGAPDLAVEVVSPSDRWPDVVVKAHVWLDAGCRVVWLVDPANRTVTVHENGGRVRENRITDAIEGGDVLPGLVVPIADIFADR